MSDRNVKLTGRELFEFLMGSRFNMTKEQAIANMRKHNQDMSFLEEEKDMIVLKLGTTDLLIDILREHIFKDMPEADSATHPIEMALLDLLIEKRNEVCKFDTDRRGVETKEKSMNEIKFEINNMESLMSNLSGFGASDTEPDSVWHWILADTVNGKEPNIPSNGRGWQLFTATMDCEGAANKLEVQAKRVVNLINEAPISKSNELREFLSDFCWRAQV